MVRGNVIERIGPVRQMEVPKGSMVIEGREK